MSKAEITKAAIIPLISIINPLFAVALGVGWEITKSIIEEENKDNVMYQNILDFFEFIRTNQDVIQEEIKTNLSSQIALVLLFEEVMKTRAQWKKEKLYRAYKGFLNTNNKEEFALERLYNTLSLIDFESYTLLRSAIENGSNSFSYKTTKSNHGRDEGVTIESEPRPVNTEELIPVYQEISSPNQVSFLVSNGLAFIPGSTWGHIVFEISEYGKQFYEYTK